MQQKTETSEQEAVFEWAALSSSRYPELRLMYHIPNEGKRSAQNGAQLQRIGLKKGVPDICLPVPHGCYSALYIELKKDSKSKPTPEQKWFVDQLNRAGNCAIVCYGSEAAIEAIKKYIKIQTREVGFYD